MIVLDASVVIGLFYPSDRHHDRAAEWMETNARRSFTVHPFTLAECLVGSAKVGRLNQLRRQIQNMGITLYQPDVDEPLLLAEIHAFTGLKLPDCCVLSTALELSAPVMTFDDKLASAARARSIDVAG